MIFNKVKDSFHEDPENIKKAVEAFSAQTEKLSKGNTQNMARALFTFGKEMKRGRRRNAGRIPAGVSFAIPLKDCFTSIPIQSSRLYSRHDRVCPSICFSPSVCLFIKFVFSLNLPLGGISLKVMFFVCPLQW